MTSHNHVSIMIRDQQGGILKHRLKRRGRKQRATLHNWFGGCG